MVTISYDGVLQDADLVTGPYADVAGAPVGHGKIYTTAATGHMRFFRARCDCCAVDFMAMAPGAYPNPWTLGNCTYQRYKWDGSLATQNDVVTIGASLGLNCDYTLKVLLAGTAGRVDVTLVHYVTGATVTALTAGGSVTA